MCINQKGNMIASGRVGNCKGLRYVGDNIALTEFSIKAGEKPAADGGKPEAIWLTVKCWRDMALLAQNIAKGDVVLVAGKFQSRPWQTDSGKSRISNEITAEFISVQVFAAAVPPVANPLNADLMNGFFELPRDGEEDDVPF